MCWCGGRRGDARWATNSSTAEGLRHDFFMTPAYPRHASTLTHFPSSTQQHQHRLSKPTANNPPPPHTHSPSPPTHLLSMSRACRVWYSACPARLHCLSPGSTSLSIILQAGRGKKAPSSRIGGKEQEEGGTGGSAPHRSRGPAVCAGTGWAAVGGRAPLAPAAAAGATKLPAAATTGAWRRRRHTAAPLAAAARKACSLDDIQEELVVALAVGVEAEHQPLPRHAHQVPRQRQVPAARAQRTTGRLTPGRARCSGSWNLAATPCTQVLTHVNLPNNPEAPPTGWLHTWLRPGPGRTGSAARA